MLINISYYFAWYYSLNFWKLSEMTAKKINFLAFLKTKMAVTHILLLFTVSSVFTAEFYDVTIYTADEMYAGTYATIRMRLFGSAGISGNIKLPYSTAYFNRGGVDKFSIKLNVLIGDVHKINIGRDDDSIIAPSWKLEKVLIERRSTGSKYEFYVNRWLVDGPDTKRYVTVTKKVNSSGCGITTQPRVVNGVTSKAGQWPWQAQLRVPLYRHYCGGTLIHPQYVLTASHCVDNVVNSKSIEVTMGEHDLNKDEGTEQRFNTSKIFVHPKWDRSKLVNDIALIKLSRPAVLNRRVDLACLPNKNDYQKEGGNCFISGWGRLHGGGPGADILQQASLPSISQSKCDKQMSSIKKITDTMLCGGGNLKSGCHGDSGGPYVCLNSQSRFIVQGAVSWGSSLCQANSYTVFARVSKFVDWIETNIYSQYISSV